MRNFTDTYKVESTTMGSDYDYQDLIELFAKRRIGPAVVKRRLDELRRSPNQFKLDVQRYERDALHRDSSVSTRD